MENRLSSDLWTKVENYIQWHVRRVYRAEWWDDLFQECRVKCWTSRHKIRTLSGFQAVVRNQCIDCVRAWTAGPEYQALDSLNVVRSMNLDSELVVNEFLAKLSARDRKLLTAVLQWETFSEASKHLGMSREALAMYFMRKRPEWKRLWRQEFGSNSKTRV